MTSDGKVLSLAALVSVRSIGSTAYHPIFSLWVSAEGS